MPLWFHVTHNHRRALSLGLTFYCLCACLFVCLFARGFWRMLRVEREWKFHGRKCPNPSTTVWNQPMWSKVGFPNVFFFVYFFMCAKLAQTHKHILTHKRTKTTKEKNEKQRKVDCKRTWNTCENLFSTEYGSDAARLYSLFKAPVPYVLEFDEKDLIGQVCALLMFPPLF